VEYRFVYRSYSHAQLLGRQKGVRDREGYEESSETQSTSEAQDWSRCLNEAAEGGFVIKNSGALPMFDNIVFWALLQKD